MHDIHPLIFSETVYATVPDLSLNYPQHPIDFSFSKILRVFPFILGALFTLSIINQSQTSRDLFWSLRIYLSSLAIASLITILQVIMSLYEIDYPYGIFNTMNSELMTAKGTVTSTSAFQLTKIHSVTQEGGALGDATYFRDCIFDWRLGGTESYIFKKSRHKSHSFVYLEYDFDNFDYRIGSVCILVPLFTAYV